MSRFKICLGWRWPALALVAGLVFSACKDGDDRPRIDFRYDFESEAELDYFVWRCGEIFERTQDFATHGAYGLRIEFGTGADPGLKPVLFHPDWSAFRFLHFDVMNSAQDSVRVFLKLAENRLTPYPDRAEKPLMLPPGTHHFAIALDSLRYASGNGIFDRKQVGLCKIYAAHPAQNMVLYFDHLYLE